MEKKLKCRPFLEIYFRIGFFKLYVIIIKCNAQIWDFSSKIWIKKDDIFKIFLNPKCGLTNKIQILREQKTEKLRK